MIVDLKRRALHQTRIMRGQLEGLEKMLDGEEYYMNITVQPLAIQKAIASLNKLVLENHLRTHA